MLNPEQFAMDILTSKPDDAHWLFNWKMLAQNPVSSPGCAKSGVQDWASLFFAKRKGSKNAAVKSILKYLPLESNCGRDIKVRRNKR